MFKKKNKIENSNQSIIDTENLIIGSTFSGKMPMIINGLDLYYLILLLQGKQITIIELGNKNRWENDLCIRYTYGNKSMTTEYYKWNSKKKEYILVPEMTVTMDK